MRFCAACIAAIAPGIRGKGGSAVACAPAGVDSGRGRDGRFPGETDAEFEEHYAGKVAALLDAAGPDLTLGADVMVGFPGETDAEFEETLAFIRSLPFGYLHLFPFSARPGTRAWALHAASPVAAEVVQQRMAALRALAAEKSETHRSRFVGRELEAITLHTPPALAHRGSTTALTENFLPVELEGCLSANRLVRVQITGLSSESTLLATALP